MKENHATNDLILVINSGSSSIKYQLLSLPTESLIAHGMVENIGGDHSRHKIFKTHISDQEPEFKRDITIANHTEGFKLILQLLTEFLSSQKSQPLSAVGHRVVHGGELFVEPTLIDATVLEAIDRLSNLAPLHNPANVLGINVCLDLFPDIPHVAVFDTAFHQTIPDYAYRYAIPEHWYRDFGIRRYGFHGSSHRFVAQKVAAFLNRPLTELNLITLHLGNGASISALENGVCIDTSMGFTPLEGLIMGTRCGDIDASIPLYVQQVGRLSHDEVEHALNFDSGLKGLAGTNDVRELLSRNEEGDESAGLALETYSYRIRKYIGAYSAILGRVDAIVFTGGIGENSTEIRSRCCRQLQKLGISIDPTLNHQPVHSLAVINRTGEPVKIFVIRTNEELQIAHDVWSLLHGKG